MTALSGFRPYEVSDRQPPSWLDADDPGTTPAPPEVRCAQVGSWLVEGAGQDQGVAGVASYETARDTALDIISSVEHSSVILGLADNWDGEGAKGYEIGTWKRAARFLAQHGDMALRSFYKGLPRPALNPADEGSIDLYWREAGRTLLVNFPADPALPASYFGKKASGAVTEGFIPDGDIRPDLVAWLVL